MNDQELQQAFIQFLAQKSGAKTQLELELYIQSLGEEGLKQAQLEFIQIMLQQQTRKAAHGAKLQYFKKLKNLCPEGEELVYYKRGGAVDCGCVKKAADGTKTPQKKTTNSVDKFKNRKKELDLAGKDSVLINNNIDPELNTQRPGDYKNKNGKVIWVPDRTKAPYNKTKKNKKGSKIKVSC